jgi:hypothetical protein
MSEAAETIRCAYCGRSFIPRAHTNQHQRPGTNPIRASRFCSSAHRQAAYRLRRATRDTASTALRVTDAGRGVAPDPKFPMAGLPRGSLKPPKSARGGYRAEDRS